MRIAIAGGTGTLGRHIVEAVRQRGDEPVVLTRGTGVDVVTGDGLDAALDGADAVVDAVNVSTLSADDAAQFFTAATGNLAAAAARAGLANLVVVSIVGIDQVPAGYYAGKLAQEDAAQRGAAPWTIQRLTQFHEFAGQIYARAKAGPLHIAPRARIQPVSAAEAAARLAELAAAPAQGRRRDLAGPREERLDDMVRAYARHTGHRGWIPSVNLPGAQMKGMRAGLALPGEGAERAVVTFDDWLAGLPETRAAASEPVSRRA